MKDMLIQRPEPARLIMAFMVLMAFAACTPEEPASVKSGYPVQPVPFTSVHLTDQFWAPRIVTNHRVTIPIAIEQSRSTGRIRNFEIAGGRAEGTFCTQYPFDDSDVYKIIEAASYSLATNPDAGLDAELDSLIVLVAGAQEEDGYLFTNLSIAEQTGSPAHEWVGDGRWELVHILSHELYNLGHLFEAAVAHHRATGKDNLLDIALKAADMLDRTFGWGREENYAGHQVVELGLVKLGLLTGEQRYLDLAKFFLDVRGPEGPEYAQAHLKVTDQTTAVGHAVRATYMYAGMADVAAVFGDDSYVSAIRSIWEDMVYRKTYVTGGIGASGGNEGFDVPYQLPNMTAYCETCASVGNVIWNHRMFLHEADGKYLDVLERTLYNAFLSGVSLSGDRFFYPNVLASDGRHERRAWFGCACCPPNVARLLPSIPGFIYATRDNDIYVNLFASSQADLSIPAGNVTIIQKGDYPWEGLMELEVGPERPSTFDLLVRIPGWATDKAIPGNLYRFRDPEDHGVEILVNDEAISCEVHKGFARIHRKWREGDRVSLELPMPVRTILADSVVEADRGRMALQRGPLVYALEWPEVPEGRALHMLFDEEQEPEVMSEPALLNGVYTLEINGRLAWETPEGDTAYGEALPVRLIPYYAWNNRGPGQMSVWLPYDKSCILPVPVPADREQ